MAQPPQPVLPGCPSNLVKGLSKLVIYNLIYNHVINWVITFATTNTVHSNPQLLQSTSWDVKSLATTRMSLAATREPFHHHDLATSVGIQPFYPWVFSMFLPSTDDPKDWHPAIQPIFHGFFWFNGNLRIPPPQCHPLSLKEDLNKAPKKGNPSIRPSAFLVKWSLRWFPCIEGLTSSLSTVPYKLYVFTPVGKWPWTFSVPRMKGWLVVVRWVGLGFSRWEWCFLGFHEKQGEPENPKANR